MYVVSKEGDRLVNMQHVMSLFIASDGCTIKAAYENGSVSQIGEYVYPSSKDVMKLIANAIKSGAEVFVMPSNETLKKRIAADTKAETHTEQHGINGQVLRRHGGS